MQQFKCKVYDDNHQFVGEYDVREDQLLLAQLQDYGVFIPSDCLEGICGSCQVKLLTGKILTINGETKISSVDELIRPCISYPQSDLEIELLE